MERDYFFVVGCPRSGTTLLSVMLDRHSRLCVPPETAFFSEIAGRLWYRRRAGVLRLLRRWPRLAELGLDADAVVGRVEGKEALAAELFAAILDLYAERQGKSRCGEKTAFHLPHVPTILHFYPRARVVCLLRDGRDNALSLIDMPWFRGNLRAAASLWLRSVRLIEGFAHRYPDRFRVVRYEELAADPSNTLPRVMTFLGEQFESSQLSSDVASGVVLPRSLQWKGEALQTTDAAAIDRRRRGAREEDLAFLERSLRKDLVRNGYVVRDVSR